MENSFIRTCWNEKIAPEDFVAKAKSEKSINYENLIKSLLNLCNLPNVLSSLMDYLYQVFVDDLATAIESVDLSNDDHINSCISIFTNYSSTFFALKEFYNIKLCDAALKILEICFLCKDEELGIKALYDISNNHIINIVLAAARYYLPEKFARIRDKWMEKRDYYLKTYDSFMFLGGIDYILKHEKYPMSFITHKDLIAFILSTLFRVSYPKNGTGRFYDSDFLLLIYSKQIKNYFSEPKMVDAFLITKTAQQKLHEIFREELTALTEELPKDEVIAAINKISENYINNIGIPREKLIEIFTKVPAEIDPCNFVDTMLEYPILCSNILWNIEDKIRKSSKEEINSMINQLYDSWDDFSYLINLTDDITSFAQFLFEQIINTSDEEMFEILWIFLLSVLKASWMTGSKKSRNDAIKACENIPENYKLFMNYFFCVDLPESNYKRTLYEVDNAPSFIDRYLYLLQYMFFYDESDSQHVINLLETHKSLWISVFTWGIVTKKPIQSNIYAHKYPDTFICNTLFDHYMSITYGKDQILSLQKNFDVLMTIHKDSQIDNACILRRFPIFSKSSWNSTILLSPLIVLWRCWIELYGPKKLVDICFSFLNHARSKSPFMSNGDHDVWIVFAYILLVVSDENADYLMETITYIESLIYSERECMINAENCAAFCIVIIISVWNKWEERSQRILDLCDRILHHEKDPPQFRLLFAYAFIKNAVYTPHLQGKVPIEYVKMFIENKDIKTATDFFIILSDLNK